MSLNPGPLTPSVLNARTVKNKGPLQADMIASNDLDFLCPMPDILGNSLCPVDLVKNLAYTSYFRHRLHLLP